jgi:hypothetical protein
MPNAKIYNITQIITEENAEKTEKPEAPTIVDGLF